jgi:hypothetical protein
LNFRHTSRRDDILSLFYLTIYLLNKQTYPVQNEDLYIKTTHNADLQYIMKQMKGYKTAVSPVEMAKRIKAFLPTIDSTKEKNRLLMESMIKVLLSKYASHATSLHYEQKPDYNLLRLIF